MKFEEAPSVIRGKSVAVIVGLLRYRKAVEDFGEHSLRYEQAESDDPSLVKDLRV
jgi:hypothetical protein